MFDSNDPNSPLNRRRGSEGRTRLKRLRALYSLQATHEHREHTTSAARLSSPLVIGAGLLIGLMGAFFVGVLMLVQSVNTAFQDLTQNLPSLSNIDNQATFKTAQIFDRNGQLLWEFYDPDGGMRTVVPLSDVSQNLIDASLAAEDAYFYQHRGVDLRATLRSAIITGSGESRTGASTITQQLVRGVILSPEESQQVTITRKLREILLAYQLEQHLSKDQILEMYLNQVFYGNQSYGVEAASENYFNTHARDLDLAQAALLAGLVQSPSAYDPTRQDLPRTADGIPVPTKERQRYVLEQMAGHGFITEDQARQAYAEPLTIQQRQVELRAPHWVMYIRDLVEQQYGAKTLYQGGLKIYTTLDANYNDAMQQVLQNDRDQIIAHGGDNAALIAVNPKTGEILAFDGSLDYNDPSIQGQVNMLLSERQPGSSIKPVIYGDAFSKGQSPGTPVDDVRTCWEDFPGHQWCPSNFDDQFHGTTTLRTALGNSLDIPAVKTLEFDGVQDVVALARQMGITTWGDDSGKTFGLSLTLGGAEVTPLDMAQVYSDLANGGVKIPLAPITRIVDAQGNILEDYRVPQGEQVLDPRAAYMVSNVLSDPAAKLFTYGRDTPLILKDRPAASKTGTTDNYRDTWTDGYTPNLAIVVWVGNTDGHPMNEVLSSMTAGKVWPDAMNASIQALNLPVEPFERPDGIVDAQVCGDTRLRPGEPLCRSDLFLPGTAPQTPINVGGSATPPPSTTQRSTAPTQAPAVPQRTQAAPTSAPRAPAPTTAPRPAAATPAAPQPAPTAPPQTAATPPPRAPAPTPARSSR